MGESVTSVLILLYLWNFVSFYYFTSFWSNSGICHGKFNLYHAIKRSIPLKLVGICQASNSSHHDRVDPVEDDSISGPSVDTKSSANGNLWKFFEPPRPARVKCLNTIGKALKYGQNHTLTG